MKWTRKHKNVTTASDNFVFRSWKRRARLDCETEDQRERRLQLCHEARRHTEQIPRADALDKRIIQFLSEMKHFSSSSMKALVRVRNKAHRRSANCRLQKDIYFFLKSAQTFVVQVQSCHFVLLPTLAGVLEAAQGQPSHGCVSNCVACGIVVGQQQPPLSTRQASAKLNLKSFRSIFSIEHYLRFQPAACVWAFVRRFHTHVSWHVAFVGILSLLCFLVCFFSRLARDILVLHGEVHAAFARVGLLYHSKSCSSLFPPLLKKKLSLAVVRF